MNTLLKLGRWPYLILIICLALAGMLYGLGRVYFDATDGFSPSAFSAPLVYDEAWSIEPLDDKKRAEIQQILNQSFRYFAKGTQSYVLVSEDGKYVIKFFKQKHLQPPLLAQIGTHLPLVSAYATKVVERRKEKKDRLLRACKLAYDHLPVDSGLLYLHFNPTNYLQTPLVIFDKQGNKHSINLNKIEFYVQLKGVPLRKHFAHFRDAGDLDGAKRALIELFSYLEDRSRRGILDRDPNFGNNLGFFGERAGNLDVGAIELDVLIKNPVEYRRRILDHMESFRRWLMFEYAELLPSYEKNLEELGVRDESPRR